ncbi:LysR family transcriptional regulator [Notoacmeibacter sp. MSK16QG-6]|uniref:LysR family transcriptional regulator n=1 Tax=Notoacmeibacter sp. MSK16QG-6 TaxID=2957982 RepID=UPI00209DF896|nr:LysR family transcriptional regulator [Notoacmeibacter sp. MSK16QG-6]MCP1198379.1 LysR family transcriptional regulator [Notoacmeibacter sp. MSK16QG-6]
MRYSLRQMQIFRAVAQQLSYTRAAEILHLTQPAVFTQVRQLEERTGQALIERVGKRLFLTDAGNAVLETARDMLAEVENLDMRLAELDGLVRGMLRLAVVSTAKYDIPPIIGAFHGKYPGIEVSMSVCNRKEMLERFSNNTDDLYVLGTPPKELAATVARYAENPLVVVAPPDHPLAGRSDISIAELSAFPFLTREQGSGTRRAAELCFEQAGAVPQTRMELGANEAVKQGVMAGLGLSVLSRGTVSLELRHGYLTELDVVGFPLIRHWYVAWPKGKRCSRAAEAFLAQLDIENPPATSSLPVEES